MSHFNVSKLSAVLVNGYIDKSNLLNSTWMELNPTKWLLSQKHKNGGNKPWDQLPADDFLSFRVARNVRKYFGMPAITDSDLADYLKNLDVWELGLNNGASKIAFDNLVSYGLDPTEANKKREFDKAKDIVRKAEEKRIADAKASFDELSELINGDFGASIENTEKYKNAFNASVVTMQGKFNTALVAAYITFNKVLDETIHPNEAEEVEALLQQMETAVEEIGGSMEPIKKRAAKYAQGTAMFNQFF